MMKYSMDIVRLALCLELEGKEGRSIRSERDSSALASTRRYDWGLRLILAHLSADATTY